MAALKFKNHAEPYGTKSEIRGRSEPCLSGRICIRGVAGRAGGGDAGGRAEESLTYSPEHYDTEVQQQVPGTGQAASCPAAQSWAPAKTCHH